MIHKILFSFFLIFHSVIFAQTKWSNSSIGLNYGFHRGTDGINKISFLSSNALTIQAKYMFQPPVSYKKLKKQTNPKFGIMLTGGFDSFRLKGSSSSRTNYSNASLEALFELLTIMQVKTEKVDLIAHLGPGLATMWNKDFKSTNAGDPYIHNHDDILNLNFGLTPQLNFENNFAMNLDFSCSYNFKQDRTFGFSLPTENKRGKIFSFSLGFIYKLK